MYKVFFNNRTVFLCDKYITNFEKFDGLFYKYETKADLVKFWEFFEIASGSLNNLFIIHEDISKLHQEFFEFFQVIDAAGGVVTNAKNQILIIKRFGKWDLPKGKLTPGENIEKAALREVNEECGISGLKIIRQLKSTYHTYYLNNQKILKKTSWFEMKYSGDETFRPQVEEDITEVVWFNRENLPEITSNTYKSIIDVLIDAGKLESANALSF